MIFYVRPFEKGESIRSSLGFMSLTSRWGNILFPGITVLTRDLRDVQALHHLATEEISQKKPNWNQFRSRRNDERVAKKLVSLVNYGSVREFTQRMTYWQRYGSLLNHFNILTSPEPLTYDGYRRMIFDEAYRPRRGQPWEKNEVQRKTRIVNANWYRQHGCEIPCEINQENLSSILSDPLRFWWLTGLNPPKRNIPDSVRLARRLEFALMVWQTTFEAAVQCVRFKKSIPERSHLRQPRLLREFLTACLQCKADGSEMGAYRDVVSNGLEIHENFFRRGYFKGWSDQIKDILDEQKSAYSYDQLTRFHDGQSVTEMAALPSGKLLEALATLHVTYCKLQDKPGSIYVEDFKNAERVNHIFPSLSLELNPGRWGLFGYRLDVSLVLHESKKYLKAVSNGN